MYRYRVTIVSPDAEARSLFVAEFERRGIQVSDKLSSVSSLVQRGELSDSDIILLHLPARESLVDLQRLTSRLPEAIVVVATGIEDARWVAKCIRGGAAQVILLPLRREDLDEALDRIARQSGDVSVTSRIIAVAGAQGGQGATFVACNLAAALAEVGPFDVLLADMNVNFGAVASYLDIEPQYSTLDLLTSDSPVDPNMVLQTLCRFSDKIQVLAAPSDAIGMRRASVRQIDGLLATLRMLGKLTVLDVPCTYDAQYFSYLTSADRIVLLAEKKVPAIRAMTRVVGKLAEEGYSRERILMTINRDGTGDSALRDEDIAQTVGLPIRHSIPNDYPVAAGSMNMGKLMNVYAPEHPIWQRIRQLAEMVLRDEPAAR